MESDEKIAKMKHLLSTELTMGFHWEKLFEISIEFLVPVGIMSILENEIN